MINMKMDIPDFRRQLAEVEKRTRTIVVRSALRAAANVYRDKAKQFAPKLKAGTPKRKKDPRVPGLLKKSIYSSRGRAGKGMERFFVAVRGEKKKLLAGRAFYWRFLEAGWYPRGRGKKLTGGDRLRALKRRRNAEGGARKITGYAFFKPAFSESSANALAAFNAKMDSGFRQFVNKGIK